MDHPNFEKTCALYFRSTIRGKDGVHWPGYPEQGKVPLTATGSDQGTASWIRELVTRVLDAHVAAQK